MNAFESQVGGFFAQVRQAAQEAAVGLAEVALNEIVKESPQYSGDFVSSWVVSSGSPDPNFRPHETPGTGKLDAQGEAEAFKKGDRPAIDHALKNAKVRFAGIKSNVALGVPIFLSNSAHHDEDYAWKIEDGTINFRPVNPNAAHVVQRAADHVGRHYKHINGAELDALRRKTK